MMIKHVSTCFEPKVAEALAAELQASDVDGWTFTVKHDPKGTGGSLIEIRDEDGFFVGCL